MIDLPRGHSGLTEHGSNWPACLQVAAARVIFLKWQSGQSLGQVPLWTHRVLCFLYNNPLHMASRSPAYIECPCCQVTSGHGETCPATLSWGAFTRYKAWPHKALSTRRKWVQPATHTFSLPMLPWIRHFSELVEFILLSWTVAQSLWSSLLQGAMGGAGKVWWHYLIMGRMQKPLQP